MSSTSSPIDPDPTDPTDPTDATLDLAPLIQAAQTASVDILMAKKAGRHLEVLRAVCQDCGERSQIAHLIHTLKCLAYSADPKGLQIVLEELGEGRLEIIAFALIWADRHPRIHGVLPTLVADPTLAPTVSEIQNRITNPTLIAQWKRFLAGRTFRLQTSS